MKYPSRDLCSGLFSFDTNVAKFAEIVIKGSHGHIFSYSLGGDQTIYKMCLGSSVSVQAIEVDRHVKNLDAGTGNKATERGANIGARMFVK